jgi:proteic killer suppression protein
VRIRNFSHKGLKRLYEDGDPRGVPGAFVDKTSKILAFLDAIEDGEELRTVPAWKAHRLAGDRKGTWSLHLTRNWRLTFWIDAQENEIRDLNLEDYH